ITENHVDIDVALTVEGCPLHQTIRADIERAIKNLPAIETVTVNLSAMTESERRQLFSDLFRKSSAESTTNAATGTDSRRPLIGPQMPPAPAFGHDTARLILGVASGKGGVGKSTVTTNLAVTLSRQGYTVGVIDMDIYGFSQGRLFGQNGRGQTNADGKIIPWNTYGVHLVSMSMFVEEGQAVLWRGPMLGKMMRQWFQDVLWPPLDILLVDLPPGTGDVALDMAQKLPQAALLLVTTPQAVAARVAHRAADVAARVHQRIIGVIENMSYAVCPTGERLNIFGQGGGAQLADDLNVPLLGQIPLEADLRETSDAGIPIAVSNPTGLSAHAFVDIARRIIPFEPTRP
ncbi:MAG: P-loop NTPase, partial [Firmicutes bacterium]|nr:P-loop NTPase [Bacillota bacterium]